MHPLPFSNSLLTHVGYAGRRAIGSCSVSDVCPPDGPGVIKANMKFILTTIEGIGIPMATSQQKRKVLFLCTGNSCRSQMAEAWLRHHGGDRFEAFSAGLDPKPIHPLTARVLSEKSIEIGGQRSKDVTEYLGKERFEYVIVVCDGANRSCPTAFPGVTHRLFWPLDDPAAFEGDEEAVINQFRVIRDQIERLIRDWLEEIPE